MKRFFFLLVMAMMVAMTFTSCNQNEPDRSGDFIITVGNITQTTVKYTIVPKDLKATYVIVTISNNLSSWSDEQILSHIKNTLDNLIEAVPEITGYDYFLSTGSHQGSQSNMKMGTDYSIVATKMDAEGNFSGHLSLKVFRTLD